MPKSLLLFILLLSLAATSAQARTRHVKQIKPITVEWVQHEISQHGAKYTVGEIYAQKRQREFLDQIEKGQADWIALAPALSAGTDANVADDLTASMAQALVSNPAAVLSVIQDSDADYERFCSIPFVGRPWPDTSLYIDKAELAVLHVGEPGLQTKKAKCLHTLQKYAQILRAVSRPPPADDRDASGN